MQFGPNPGGESDEPFDSEPMDESRQNKLGEVYENLMDMLERAKITSPEAAALLGVAFAEIIYIENFRESVYQSFICSLIENLKTKGAPQNFQSFIKGLKIKNCDEDT